MQPKTLCLVSILLIILTIGCTPKAFRQESISASAVAEPGAETMISLEDGASITVPEASLEEPVAITIERNPGKIDDLPSIPDDLRPLSGFYNFVITSGTLIGPVDLTLPFDIDQIPEDEGELVMAFPVGDTWQMVPVEAADNLVTLYTDNVGDPLIAWHFSDIKGPRNASRLSCAPNIPMSVIVNAGKLWIFGQLKVPPTYPYGNGDSLVQAVKVKLVLNQTASDTGVIIETVSDSKGMFFKVIDVQEGVRQGWNWIFATADCRPERSDYSEAFGPSKGYVEFKVDSVEAAASPQTTSPVSAPTGPDLTIPLPELSGPQTPGSVEPTPPATIPAGAVQLPDFRGMSLDEAVTWLTSNGFGYLWVDGSSVYDLGMLYGQAPAGGTYHVPHRTTVVLYRTTTKMDPEISFTAKSSGSNGECTRISWSVVAPGVTDITLDGQGVGLIGSQEFCPTESTTITLKLYTNNGLLTSADQIIQVRPVLTLDRTYFCRKGPKSSYSDVLDFPKGTVLPIIGRSSNGWWQVEIHDSRTSTTSCWIGGGQASGDTGALPITEVQASSGNSQPAASTPAPYPGP